MVLACVAMLLIPSFWEGRRHAPGARGRSRPRRPSRPLHADPRKTCSPAWRGPRKRGDEDG